MVHATEDHGRLTSTHMTPAFGDASGKGHVEIMEGCGEDLTAVGLLLVHRRSTGAIVLSSRYDTVNVSWSAS